jgi:hypothetical protein
VLNNNENHFESEINETTEKSFLSTLEDDDGCFNGKQIDLYSIELELSEFLLFKNRSILKIK